jgi:hypothetical protein
VNGHCPQLADLERLDALVGPDEASKCLQLEPAVGVGHIGPSQPIDPWASRQVALGDLRQSAVVAPREMVPDLPKLLVGHVKVVEEPLLGERELALLQDRFDDVPIRVQKHAAVFADPGEEVPPPRGLRRGALSRGQTLGVLLQASDAKDLGSDRLFFVRRGDGHVREVHFELPALRAALRVPSPGEVARPHPGGGRRACLADSRETER